MAFNFNYFKGSTMNQIQNALHYWMTALVPVEEADKLKEEKEKEIVANVVVEGVEDDKKEDERIANPVPTLCMSQSHPHIYD